MEQPQTQPLSKPKETSSFFSRVNIRIGGGFVAEDRMAFARNLSAMIKAGLPLSRALGVLLRQSRKPSVQKVMEALKAAIIRGETFHAALAAFPHVFSPLFVAIVKAGEESGGLYGSLQTIGVHLEKSYELEKRIHTALVYPAIIVIAMIAVAAIMLFYVVPVLSTTFNELGVELPLSTRVVIETSDFIRTSSSLVLFLFAAALLLFAGAAKTKNGMRVYDWSVLHTPLIAGIVREVNTARTARTLSSLLSAGLPMTEGLSVAKEVVQNAYYKEVLVEAETSVTKGDVLSEIFGRHETLYPPLFSEMVAVGEETGKLSDLLLETALFYESEVDRATRDMSSVIEPFLMVVIGIAVGFFALAMITPMYTIVGSI